MDRENPEEHRSSSYTKPWFAALNNVCVCVCVHACALMCLCWDMQSHPWFTVVSNMLVCLGACVCAHAYVYMLGHSRRFPDRIWVRKLGILTEVLCNLPLYKWWHSTLTCVTCLLGEIIPAFMHRLHVSGLCRVTNRLCGYKKALICTCVWWNSEVLWLLL
jgi:hypothetical protein